MIFIGLSGYVAKRRDSNTGLIVLYNALGNLLASRRYCKLSGRRSVMRYWLILYGEEKMKTFYVHVIPDIKL